MRFMVYRTFLRQWRWNLIAANGKKVATSGESYHNKQDCYRAIDLVKRTENTPVLDA